MRALVGSRNHRSAAVLLAVAIFCVFILTPTEAVVAKTRPPIEMGDPDDTGDQGQIPGPTGRVKVSTTSVATVTRSTQVAIGEFSYVSRSIVIRGLLVFLRLRY